MSLSDKQAQLTTSMAEFILWCNTLPGYKVVVGEVMRTFPQQLLYYFGWTLIRGSGSAKGMGFILKKVKPRSKTLNTAHRKKLAFDLLVWYNGKYQKTSYRYEILGKKWKAMNPEHVWGGDFPSNDANHFQLGQ